jgi:hypothetical protein
LIKQYLSFLEERYGPCIRGCSAEVCVRFEQAISMIKDQLRKPAESPGAVGIVVKSGQPAALPLRGAAFVWGKMEVSPAPSLPFGRWKAVGCPAA